MRYYTALFQSVAELPSDVPRLAALKQKMSIGDVQFESALASLQRIVQFAYGRKSALMCIPWIAAQLLWFWDFHVLERLEKWQVQFGPHLNEWFTAVGELEALSSLAALKHDHPDWQFADVQDGHAQIVGEQMGHPLLKECVRNSASIGPDGSFLLVTGSNMSGKSTLLRSFGVNTVLALAGGPVCADSFQLPPVEIATSMRITDSLDSGVSFFMAELKRIKSIVDRARVLDDEGGVRLFYLLDEILQGTNSAERHVAVTRIISHLLQTRALGAVSTHDLELADSAELAEKSQLVHLRETIEDVDGVEQMRFDYVVREGVTPTTNALKLLELVGLGESR